MVCSSVNGLRALRMCVLGPTLGLEELLTSAQWTAVCGDSASVRLPALGPLGRAVLGAAGGHRCGQPPELPWWLALWALSSSRCPGALDRPRLPAPAAHPPCRWLALPCLAQPPCFPDEFQAPRPYSKTSLSSPRPRLPSALPRLPLSDLPFRPSVLGWACLAETSRL